MNTNLLQDAISFPFRGNGKYILLWGVILGVAADLASLAGPLALFAGLILSAYFCAIFFDILTNSATGNYEAPGFPNLSDITNDIIFPYLKVAGCTIVSFGPFFIYSIAVDEQSLSMPVYLGLLFLGACYFPMAILAVGVLDMFSAILPHIVIPSIFRAGGLYWIVVSILFGVTMLSIFAGATIGQVFIAGSLFMAAFSMVTLMFNARLLGTLYLQKAEDLNWL